MKTLVPFPNTPRATTPLPRLAPVLRMACSVLIAAATSGTATAAAAEDDLPAPPASATKADTSNAPAPFVVVVVTPDYLRLLSNVIETNNPALRAAAARTTAAEAGVDAVRTWDDPMLMLGGMISEEEMRAEDGDLLYGVQQKLPLFGRPAAAKRRARAELEVARADASFQFQMLRRDLAKALFRAALSDRVVDIGVQDLGWVEANLAATGRRYQVGEGTQAQLLRLESERLKRIDQLITDRRRRDQTRVVLDRLLGRTNAPAWPRLALPEPAGHVEFSDALVALATGSEPRLLVMQKMVAEADAMVGIARRMRKPEISIGAEARNFTGNGDFRQAMLTLSMSLPWFNSGRYRSDIRREESRRFAAELDVLDYQFAIRAEIGELVTAIDAARREALLYRDEIAPRSERALQSSETAWIAGRGMFLEVLEARRMLLESRLMYARAVAEQYTMLAELVLCCGLADFDALTMINAQAPEAPAPQNPPQP